MWEITLNEEGQSEFLSPHCPSQTDIGPTESHGTGKRKSSWVCLDTDIYSH